jgi:hypothetical protein
MYIFEDFYMNFSIISIRYSKKGEAYEVNFMER